MEMLYQIIQGQPEPSYIKHADCMPTGHPTPDNDKLPSSPIDPHSSLPLQPASGDLRPFGYVQHNYKQRLLSTDSGVELKGNYPVNDCESPCKRNESSYVPLTEATSMPSNHNQHLLMLKHNDPYATRSGSLTDYTDLPLCTNSKPELVEREADTDVFKSSQQNGDYITQDMFNEMVAEPATFITQQVGSYVRPDTLEWDNTLVEIEDSKYHYHEGTYNGSVFTDSGHSSDKNIEQVTIDMKQHLQFNIDGYVTSPVD